MFVTVFVAQLNIITQLSSNMKLILFIAIFIMTVTINQTVSAEKLDADKMYSRAVVDAGNTSRLKHVFEKAKRGEKITVGVIGGSITQGACASKPENRWANLVTKWWKKKFPKAKIELVNAGIGATGSLYGAARAQNHLLKYKPDFVVVEYAVNDPNDEEHAKSMEGLLRQILDSPKKTAVMMLFTMNKNGQNAQQWHSKVGRHYGIPMISYRDAVWPEVAKGKITWKDISPDEVHPNDRGHKYCAAFLTRFLDGVLDGNTKNEVPEPLFTDIYETARQFCRNDLVPTSNKGWKKNKNGWEAGKPGSEIAFEVPGRLIAIRFYRVCGDMGIVKVTVDGKNPVKLNGWFGATWGGYTPTEIVAKGLSPGVHKVRIRLLEDKAAESKGHKFEIHEILSFGK